MRLAFALSLTVFLATASVSTAQIETEPEPQVRIVSVYTPPPPAVTVELADRMASHAFAIGTSMAGDLYSTAWALKRCPGCYEANPLGFDAEARISLKIGIGTAAMVGCWKLEKDGHTGAAKGLRWGAVAVHAIAIVINSKHAITRR